jgi:hypothetical protein
VIETPEQFVEAYEEILEQAALERILGSSLDNAIVKYTGVGLGAGDIWFYPFCDTPDCETTSPRIFAFMGYCQYDEEYMAQGYRLAEPGVFNDGTTFQFGTYWVTSVENIGGSLLTEEVISSFQSITIQETFVDSTNAGRFAVACSQPELEYCGLFTSKWRPLEVYPIGTLNILCHQKISFVFDVLATGQLGYYYSGRYFFLELIEEAN